MEHAEHAQHGLELAPYIWHFLAGCVFAVSGIYARNFCKHVYHQIVVAALLIALETIFVVTVIG